MFASGMGTSGEGECCKMVPIYNMASGSPEGLEPEWEEPICHRFIQERFVRPGIKPVLVSGRSMEPTFKDGAVVGVDLNDKRVVSGEAYAVLIPYEGARQLKPSGIWPRPTWRNGPSRARKAGRRMNG